MYAPVSGIGVSAALSHTDLHLVMLSCSVTMWSISRCTCICTLHSVETHYEEHTYSELISASSG